MSSKGREHWWGLVFLGGLALGLMVVLARCVQLQWHDSAVYQQRAARQELKIIPQTARRGLIVDRQGRVLAISVPRVSVGVDPNAVTDAAVVARSLGEVLSLDAGDLYAQIKGSTDRRFLWIKRYLDPAVGPRLERLALPGVVLHREYERQYPMGNVAAHVLGFTDVDGRGLEGVEAVYENDLAAQPGKWLLRSDVARRPIGMQGACDNGEDGNTVVLALDAVIQNIVQEEIERTATKYRAKGVIGIVMEPRSGEVLALANWPGFDPGAARTTAVALRRNQALTDPVEPGSTFKPFTIASALAGGYVKVDDIIYCHDGYYSGPGFRPIREYDGHRYGNLTVREIIARSSNIGAAIVAQKMGKTYFHRMIEEFGFGQKTGIDLRGESEGILRPLKRWNDKDNTLTRAAFGQSEAVTPLQLIRGFCCFANGGVLVRPRVVRGILSSTGAVVKDFGLAPAVTLAGGNEAPAQTEKRVIPADIARTMTQDVLTAVVEGEHGTARIAKLEGYRVFGKTGTAQVPKMGGRGYDDGKYVASFMAGAPAEDPKVCVLVVVREPDRRLGLGYTGGVVAAPPAREILRRTLPYLGVPEQKTPETETRLAAR
jgi:cell division protein FtsI/penicillin-binding protein 2